MPVNPFRRKLPEPVDAGIGGDERETRMLELAGLLQHGDRGQLAFQISEIAGDRIYEQGGINLESGATVIDAGGNFGVSAAHFAVQCGAGAVHSFEPVPATFEVLERNVGSVPGCFPHNMGLGARNERSDITWFPGGDSVMSGRDADPEHIRELLAIAGENLGMSAGDAETMAKERLLPQTVECGFTTLSSFIAKEEIETVDLLKIDVEGAEVDVLKGIEDRDWPRVRQIAAEIHSLELLRDFEGLLKDRSFEIVVEQDSQLSGTPIRLLYATR